MTTRPTVEEAADFTTEREREEQRLLATAALPTGQLRAADPPDELLLELLEASWLGTLPYARTVMVPADRIVRDSNGPEGGRS
jgi:hypothetical protein